jgi:hypothetical protein
MFGGYERVKEYIEMCGPESNSIKRHLPIGLREALDAVVPHDHLCLIYETDEQWLNTLEYFLAGGLRRDEKCVYIIDDRTAAQVKESLRSRGLDIAAAEDRGQFVVLSETETYTSGGRFDPDRMLSMLKNQTDKALSEGFSALRVTGEMSWALKGAPGSERLIEYEAKLNTFFPITVAARCASTIAAVSTPTLFWGSFIPIRWPLSATGCWIISITYLLTIFSPETARRPLGPLD